MGSLRFIFIYFYVYKRYALVPVRVMSKVDLILGKTTSTNAHISPLRSRGDSPYVITTSTGINARHRAAFRRVDSSVLGPQPCPRHPAILKPENHAPELRRRNSSLTDALVGAGPRGAPALCVELPLVLRDVATRELHERHKVRHNTLAG